MENVSFAIGTKGFAVKNVKIEDGDQRMASKGQWKHLRLWTSMKRS